jgi:predicted RNA-binding Zn ribbon-like protein
MATSAKAPGRLELVREFVNSLDVEEATDELGTTEGLASWLVDHGLPPGNGRISERDRRRIVELREALRSLLLVNGGHAGDPTAAGTLNQMGTAAPLQVRFDDEGGQTVLHPAGRGIEAAVGAILAIVFSSMADGTWPRLKACSADDCMWAFYDRSKNRSATWCSMEVCGNRAKARSYRARQRGDKPA